MSDTTLIDNENAAPDTLVMNLTPDALDCGRTPLADSAVESHGSDGEQAGIWFSELPLLDHLTFRCQASDPQQQAFEQIMGCPLPIAPLTAACTEGCTIRWLSPDEWLITIPPGAAFGLETAFRATMPGLFSLVNGSGGMTVFRLGGPKVIDLLKKCVSVDLHSSVFPEDKVVSTNFAKATCVLHRTAPDAFDLVVRRSYADYIWRWIADAGQEFGLRVES